MSNIKHHNCKNTLSKWLLAAVLLLSCFTFCGPSVQSPAKVCTRQTALLISNSASQVKGVLLYRIQRRPCTKQPAVYFYAVSSFNLVTLHSRQINTLLKNNSPAKLPVVHAGFFYQAKTIPQNTGDGSFSLLG
jgi:hypothetical protein